MPKKTTTKPKSSTKKTTKKRAASKKAVTASFAKPGAPKVKVRGGKMYPPSKIYAQVSPHSVGGVSMFESGVEVNADTAANFTSELGIIQAAADKLREAGFEVLQASESTINIAGSPKAYHEAFGAPITVRQEEVIKEFGLKDKAEFLDCPNSDLPGLISTKGTAFQNLIEGVALEEPRYYMAADRFPPSVDYWHLDVPGDVSLACNADKAHRMGITGKGVTVSMVDSGWFRHPFFRQRGYRSDSAILGPGASNPAADESGHGTGESANIFSVAPDVHLKPVKMSFTNSIAAFNAAVGLGPDIITCSWGSDIQRGPLSAANVALANAVAAAVASGITVVFSSGNGHYGFPGAHPDVISAGGCFMSRDGSLRASDYASGFASEVYPGRNVPDLSGLVGMRPGAKYIMLPVEPGDSIDVGGAGGNHPNGDETATNDGWAAFSGTSAAAPQLAGAAALVKQACGRLSPARIRDTLKVTATDVRVGRCNPRQNNPATPGPDLATGHGKVDAYRAVLRARAMCRLNIQPIQPVQPVQPIRPIRPDPIRPIGPPRPIRPVQPINPVGPVSPGSLQGETEEPLQQRHNADEFGDAYVSDDELTTLEDMIEKGQLDPSDA